MARCLPQSLGTLSMPIETRLHSTTTAFYFPVNNSGNGSNALYSFTGVNLPGGPTVNLGYNTVGTTTLLMGADRATTTGPPHSGIQTMFELEYARTISGPGYGAVTTGMIDVDWDRRFVVEKESAPNVWPRDLYRPVVLYRWLYDYPEGDLNCDCIVDVSDLTDIISFLFISFVTPLPCPCMPF
ncbi:MAG: hypothetical protein KKA42_06810, partial [candidate division Zixibacteria bacterium]|nr:hypothetical protein [candidate division Zixibacteria bacterium]